MNFLQPQLSIHTLADHHNLLEIIVYRVLKIITRMAMEKSANILICIEHMELL